MRIELTKLTKDGGPLTKRISLSPDGTLVKDGSACVMWQGAAERIRLNGVDALAALIESLTPSQALALGALCPTLPDKVEITTKKKLLNGVAWPDVIARTGDNIIYHGGQPAFALLDYDSKGMPTAVAAELECVGGFWVALCTVLPALGAAARVTRRSTSAGLSRADTGEVLPGSDGVHVYVEVKDGADNERFLRALHDRCWLAGLGWMMVSRSGALLERSIIDRMVGGPERLVFEGGPVLEPPLQQDEKSRHSIAVDGVVLDTVAVCPPLTVVEMARLEEFKAKESHRLAPEVAKAKAAFIERQAKKLAERTGIPEHTAKHIVLRQCDGVLRPDIELPFDDPELTGCTVGDVLADPDRFVDKTLADPLEGVDYGPSKAKIMRRADGSMWINSFAHGRTTYELKHSAASVRKAMTAAVKEEVVTTFTRLVVCADVDAVELEELRQLAAEQSGVGLRVVDRALKAARRMHAEDCNREMRRHRAAQRLDPRPRIAAPLPDAQFLPTMDDLNAVIGKVDAAVPPLRDIAGVMTRTRKLPIPKMHGFTETEANPEEEPASCTAMRMTKLPAPEQWVLSRMNEMECAEMIEQYIDYYVEDKNGERRSVHLNREFVKHYLQRHDGVLPTAVAIPTRHTTAIEAAASRLGSSPPPFPDRICIGTHAHELIASATPPQTLVHKGHGSDAAYKIVKIADTETEIRIAPTVPRATATFGRAGHLRATNTADAINATTSTGEPVSFSCAARVAATIAPKLTSSLSSTAL